ncbi:MAG: DUF6465 family protein [Ruminococcus flavefaciens]|nr:DUF6465 family protein [Ruminococcus flavefaciens]MCM1058998.1 DUF6465 family protein [Eubacterium sp.]
MPRAKKTSTAATAKKEVKAAVTAAPVEETKPVEEKKPAAKKTASKSSSAVETKVVIQANGSEVIAADLVEKAKAAAGVKSIKKVDVYVKPEVNKVYYVVNGDTFGDFDLF